MLCDLTNVLAHSLADRDGPVTFMVAHGESSDVEASMKIDDSNCGRFAETGAKDGRDLVLRPAIFLVIAILDGILSASQARLYRGGARSYAR
jgi:hypothetical protein